MQAGSLASVPGKDMSVQGKGAGTPQVCRLAAAHAAFVLCRSVASGGCRMQGMGLLRWVMGNALCSPQSIIHKPPGRVRSQAF